MPALFPSALGRWNGNRNDWLEVYFPDEEGGWLKVKFSTVALLVCIAALAADVVLAVMYFQQQGEQGSLASELTAAKGALTEYSGNASSLEEQLTLAKTRLAEEQLESAEARLIVEQAYSPDKLSSGGILNGVLQVARESKVDVVEVSTQPEGDEEMDGQTYSTLSIDLQVKGSLSDLVTFIHNLEKGAIKAVTVDEIIIEEAGDSYDASMSFSVFYPRL